MEQKKRIRLKIANPCSVDWDSMKGDDAVRFCGVCQKNVYQLSNMTTEQVEELLAKKGGRTCVRFYQRADGTLLSEDCSVGRKRRRRKQAAMGAGLGVLSALGVGLGGIGQRPLAKKQEAVVEPHMVEPHMVEPPPLEPDTAEPDTLEPPTEPVEPIEVMMGEMVAVDYEDDEDLANELDEAIKEAEAKAKHR